MVHEVYVAKKLHVCKTDYRRKSRTRKIKQTLPLLPQIRIPGKIVLPSQYTECIKNCIGHGFESQKLSILRWDMLTSMQSLPYF